MKNIFILLLLIPSVRSYSQTNQSRYMAAQSVQPYDTVRAISEVNDLTNADAYPWISPDGLRLYFTRGSAAGTNQLQYADRASTNAFFNPPVAVPLGLSSLTSCWLSDNELNIYICKNDTLFFADRLNTASAFNTPVEVNLTGSAPYGFIIGASLNAAQDKLFLSLLYTSTYTFGTSEFTRTSSSSFSYVRTFTAPTGYVYNAGQLSKDELHYFFSAKFNLGNALLYEVSRSTPPDSFDFSTLLPVPGINDPVISNIQPSMSDSLNWVAFVRNSSGYWEGNDLYIAHKNIITAVFDPEKNPFSVSLFPNPTSGSFTISLPGVPAEITITDLPGKEILKRTTAQKEMTLRLDNSGVYFIRIKTKDGIRTRKLIVNR